MVKTHSLVKIIKLDFQSISTTRDRSKHKDTERKKTEKYHANIRQKKAGVAILVSKNLTL